MIKKDQSGQILVVVFVALGVVLFTVLSIIAGAQVYFQSSSYSIDAEKATALAESGVDKAINSLNKTGGAYSGETETTLGEGSYSVTVTSKDAATKSIEATGYIPSKEKAKVKRRIKISASRGVGVAFVYGIQVGEGGLELGNNNTVMGSIYSNGNIEAGNSNEITGDAWVAGGRQPTADQQTDCQGANCIDFLFGKDVSGEIRLDVAQSFKPSQSATLNKVSLKIKKIGNPPDAIVRILRDSGGIPDKNGVLATGTLFSSLVTSAYDFIDVTFDRTPLLNLDTTYWIMVDTSSNAANYWVWQNDLAQSYTRGQPKWSPNWQAGNPTWTLLLGDLSFKTYMGGSPSFIKGNQNFVVRGDAHANTIENLTIGKNAYFQTIINSTVAGTSFPNSADPPPKVFPLSEANILDWKRQAETAGVSVGNIVSCVPTLGPGKIVGNVAFANNCIVVVKSPVWITGNLELNNSNTLRLDSSFGTTSGVIVIDGTADFGNSNKLEGTGQGSSLLMLLSAFDSRTSGISAISVNNTGNSGVLYAHNGIIEPGNTNTFKELTAWKIKLVNNSVINYETGLSSTLFSSGPAGTYSLVKGTYQVK